LKNSREEYNRSDMTTILNINKNLKGGWNKGKNGYIFYFWIWCYIEWI
jgi:hypothetical protein